MFGFILLSLIADKILFSDLSICIIYNFSSYKHLPKQITTVSMPISGIHVSTQAC